MNGSSNSTQRSALLASGQVYRDEEFPVITGSLSCLPSMQSRACRTLSLEHCAHGHAHCVCWRFHSTHSTAVNARAHARAQACHASAQHPVVHAGLLYGSRQKNTLLQHHPWKTLSRHKIFYRDKNVPPLGKLYRDTRRPLSSPSLASPKPCCDTEFLSRHKADKSLLRQRRPLSRPKPPNMPRNSVATRRSLSQHRARKLCRVRMLSCLARIPTARASQLCSLRSGRAPGLRTISRHGKPRATQGQHSMSRQRPENGQ